MNHLKDIIQHHSKRLLIAALITLSTVKLWPCGGGDYEDEYYYYSLIFSQELINDERYYPFLLACDYPYYKADSVNIKNGNIEEWEQYLKISYDQAYYLVFKAKKEEVQDLLSRKPVSNNQLTFADESFIKKYKDALQYILKAKELEPYMRIIGSEGDWYYYETPEYDIETLPYDQICLELQKAWKQTKDKEIKLRYGYQLVRFAHYNRKYNESIAFFDEYVTPLKYKPEMYYYALSQLAGAIRGAGNVIDANKLFFEVFSYSSDLKTVAISSIRFTEDFDFDFRSDANTTDEKNDADLLFGYKSFSNPIASAHRIVSRSPDAVQAKVLTARAISMIEDDIKKYGDVSGYKNRRFPIIDKSGEKSMKEAVEFVTGQANSVNVKQKNYWNIASAYLCYLNRDFTNAQAYLDKVDTREEGYQDQRDILAMIIDIGREPVINREVEDRIFNTYNDIFAYSTGKGRSKAEGFVMDLLSNRYYLQEDYAKSFMLLNSLEVLQDNPNLTLLNAIESLYNKSDKGAFEKHLTRYFSVGVSSAMKEGITVPNYIKYMKGYIYLTADQLEQAKEMFEASGFSGETLSPEVFGYNRIECFTCEENMATDYLDDFPYLGSSMSEKELVDILIQLEKDAAGSSSKAAKANYLVGNFYYNTSVTGYFRNYLRYGYVGGYRQRFFNKSQKDDIFKDKMFLKDIPIYYDNPVEIANKYLEKAYSIASGDEFKARIVFALSKCEQEMHYQKIENQNEDYYFPMYYSKDWVMISDRQYFKELMKYSNTRFFKEVETNCKYFEYYVSHL